MKLILKLITIAKNYIISLKKKSPQTHCCIWGDSKYNLVDMKSYFFFLSVGCSFSIGLSLAL